MTWDNSIKLTDIAIVLAALLGPVFAVQVQVFLERRREQKRRRTNIFHTLMRTRAQNLSGDHVQALNAIPIEFYGVVEITAAYKAYIRHLDAPQTNPQGWADRRTDLFMDLLSKVAVHLGYRFDVVQLKNEFYAPQAHFTVEAEQAAIREGLAKVLSGKLPLPMEVKAFPGDAETQGMLKQWLKGERAVKVETVDEPLLK
jgi:hypothetical protein